jgi:hypothetical protein
MLMEQYPIPKEHLPAARDIARDVRKLCRAWAGKWFPANAIDPGVMDGIAAWLSMVAAVPPGEYAVLSDHTTHAVTVFYARDKGMPFAKRIRTMEGPIDQGGAFDEEWLGYLDFHDCRGVLPKLYNIPETNQAQDDKLGM